MDTGLDQYSCFFYDSDNGVTTTSSISDIIDGTVTTDLTKRKIVQYIAWEDSGDYDVGLGLAHTSLTTHDSPPKIHHHHHSSTTSAHPPTNHPPLIHHSSTHHSSTTSPATARTLLVRSRVRFTHRGEA